MHPRLFDRAQACKACTDACLGEQNTAMLIRCIRLDFDRADVCDATGKILSRQTAFEPAMARSTVDASAAACRLCGDECDRQAQHGMEHCRICAEACRRCKQACGVLLGELPGVA